MPQPLPGIHWLTLLLAASVKVLPATARIQRRAHHQGSLSSLEQKASREHSRAHLIPFFSFQRLARNLTNESALSAVIFTNSSMQATGGSPQNMTGPLGVSAEDEDVDIVDGNATSKGGSKWGRLQVGTTPKGANVMVDFDVVPSWESGEDLAADAATDEPSTNFYLLANDSRLVLSRAEVVSSNTTLAQPVWIGDVKKRILKRGKALILPNQDEKIKVVYHCSSPGDTDIFLILEFEDFSPVTVRWRKHCGGIQNTALTVMSGEERVVFCGEPAWNKSHVVGLLPTQTEFILSVDPLSDQPEQIIDTPRLTTEGSCTIQSLYELDPQTPISTSLPPIKTRVQYGCLKRGPCLVTMEVPFYPDMAPYRPLRWQWTKQCGGQAVGLNIETDTETGRHILVTDGLPVTDITSWHVHDSEDIHKVVLVNDAKKSLVPVVHVRQLRVRCLDINRCDATLRTRPHFHELRADSPMQLDVQYACRKSGGSVVELVVDTEGRDPVLVQWNKDCTIWIDSLAGSIFTAFCMCIFAACACLGGLKLCFEGPPKDLQRRLTQEFN